MSFATKPEPARDFILRVSSCLTPLERIHNASILCQGGMIQAIGGYSALRVLEDIPCIDMSDCHAMPGLIDTHLHGSGGFAAMDAGPEPDLTGMSRVLARHGVTSFVITVLSASSARLLAVIEALAGAHDEPWPGAVPVGIHLEGPYLNRAKSGAQDAGLLRAIDLGELRELLQAGRQRVRFMTFAPELDGSERLVEALTEAGVIASMGHSLAGEEHVLRAISAGARRCTHLFNGMPPLNQRETGLTTVGLTDDRLTIELIADGIHVHPRMIDLACRTKPETSVVGITDATQGAGMPDGLYRYGGEEIRVSRGESRRTSDGTLAGSALTLDQAMRNLGTFSALSENQVVACFTSNAASSIGVTDRGVLRPGKRADIAVVDDAGIVQMTLVAGAIAYDRRESAA